MKGLASGTLLSILGAFALTLIGACATGLQEPADQGSGGSGGQAPSGAGGHDNAASSGTGQATSSSSAGAGGGASSSSSSASSSSGGPACGDAVCEPGETCMSCPGDCGMCPVVCMGTTADCDGNAANGCECPSAGCCGAACEIQHQNGLGQTYASCDPLGTPGTPATYSVAMATAARAAWPTAGADSMGTCAVGLNNAKCLARMDASSCAVWCYTTKMLAGHVHLNAASSMCTCPTAADLTWN